MEDVKQAYDVFNRLWEKVPRSIRADRESNRLMLELRAYFDALIEKSKQTEILNTALAVAAKPADGPVPEEIELANPIHLALRLLRTLSRHEWEMVKAIVDLHKFSPEDVLDILDEIQDTHCPRCGEWLDDDDKHENCPVPAEEEETADIATTTAVTVPATPGVPASAPASVTPVSQAAESQLKTPPVE